MGHGCFSTTSCFSFFFYRWGYTDISQGSWCLPEIDGIPCVTAIGCVASVRVSCKPPTCTYWCCLRLIFFLRLPTEITFWTKYEPIWTLFLLSHKYEFPHWSIMSSFWCYCLNWLSWFRPCRVCSVHRKRLRSSRPRTGWAPILTETSGSRSWVSQGRPQVVAIFLTSSLGGSSLLSQKTHG